MKRVHRKHAADALVIACRICGAPAGAPCRRVSIEQIIAGQVDKTLGGRGPATAS